MIKVNHRGMVFTHPGWPSSDEFFDKVAEPMAVVLDGPILKFAPILLSQWRQVANKADDAMAAGITVALAHRDAIGEVLVDGPGRVVLSDLRRPEVRALVNYVLSGCRCSTAPPPAPKPAAKGSKRRAPPVPKPSTPWLVDVVVGGTGGGWPIDNDPWGPYRVAAEVVWYAQGFPSLAGSPSAAVEAAQ